MWGENLISGVVRCRWRHWLCERFRSIKPQLVGGPSRGWSLRSGNQWLSGTVHFRSDVSWRRRWWWPFISFVRSSHSKFSIRSTSSVSFIITEHQSRFKENMFRVVYLLIICFWSSISWCSRICRAGRSSCAPRICRRRTVSGTEPTSTGYSIR